MFGKTIMFGMICVAIMDLTRFELLHEMNMRILIEHDNERLINELKRCGEKKNGEV